jgi:hypothetical protein
VRAGRGRRLPRHRAQARGAPPVHVVRFAAWKHVLLVLAIKVHP